MKGRILPVCSRDESLVCQWVARQEPWSIIALDALLLYGFKHPQHRWYIEKENERVLGVIYQHNQLLQLIYRQAPPPSSPLYAFIHSQLPTFITHGKAEILKPILSHLPDYQATLEMVGPFLEQTPQLAAMVKQPIAGGDPPSIRFARLKDIGRLNRLFQGSSIDQAVDPELIQELIPWKRVMIAEKKGKLIGSMMLLKESLNYALLGGLYVAPEERHKKTAIRLGQQMIQYCWQRGKKICFYYHDSNLIHFYQKYALQPMGDWASLAAKRKE